MPRTWTTDELADVIAGARIVARGADARAVALPSAFTIVAEPDPRPWGHHVDQVHAPDRAALVNGWWQSLRSPGELIEIEVRADTRNGWQGERCQYVNLLDDPAFGFVLVAIHPLGPIDPPTDEIALPERASFSAPAWIVQHLDEVGVVLRTDGHVEEIFGVGDDELVGHTVVERLHPEDRDAAIAMWLEVLADTRGSRTIDQRVVRPDGSDVWITSTVINRLDDSGTLMAVSYDISRERERDRALAAREAELRFLTEEVPVGVFRADGDRALTVCNGRVVELVGPLESLDDLVGALHEHERDAVATTLREAMDHGTVGRVRARTRTGDRFLDVRIRGINDLDGASPGVIGTIDDVTQEVVQRFRLRETAERDPLTELANRRGVTRALETAVAGSQPVLVVFGDLDGFKQVNDRWGHDAGDLVLREIAARLQATVRPGDVVGRWGGDEFVIVCRSVPADADGEVLQRLGAALEEPIPVGPHHYQAAVSLGAVRPEPGESAEGVLRRADTRMYEAKRSRHQR